MSNYKVVVAGGRNFNNYQLLNEKLDKILKNKMPNVTIISGTAKGADRLGELYAQHHNIALQQYPANWDFFGRRAGYLRNIQMAEAADAVIVFWDGESRGTKMMIDIAKTYHLPLRIIRY